MSEDPRVFVVVVDWNGASRTVDCLRALAVARHRGLRTILVDNGSDDPDAVPALASRRGVCTLRLERNLGFSGGSNAGIRLACEEGADWIWLLNNDAEPAPDALAAMLETGRSDPRIGAVGSVLDESRDGHPAAVYGGGRVSFWTGLPRHQERPIEGDRLDYLRGASLLLRRSALDTIGWLDEGFFLYWEDADLCFRLRAAGWRLAVSENALVRHRGYGSLAFQSPKGDHHFTRSSVRFFRRHAPLPAWPIAISGSGRMLARLLRGRWSNARAVGRALRLGWRDEPRLRPARLPVACSCAASPHTRRPSLALPGSDFPRARPHTGVRADAATSSGRRARCAEPPVVLLDAASFTPFYDSDLAGALDRLGWSVEWITSRWEFEDVPAPRGVRHSRVFFDGLQRAFPERRSKGGRRKALRRLLKGLLYPASLMRLARMLRARPPGILHVQWAHLAWLDARLWSSLRRAGWVVVYTIHDAEPLAGNRSGPTGFAARALRVATDAVVVHDEAARRLLVQAGLPRRHVHVIPPGTRAAPRDAPTRASARASLEIPGSAPVVLFFGFIKPYKGLEILLQSVCSLVRCFPELVLLIAGEPMGRRARFDRLIEELGVGAHVRWTGGFVPTAEVARYFAAADVVALPYLAASSSAVCLTAYAYARPVVATAVGGLPALVEPGRSGLLVPPRDPVALASALAELLADPVRSARMGERGRHLAVTHHSWDRVAAQHAALYSALRVHEDASPVADALAR